MSEVVDVNQKKTDCDNEIWDFLVDSLYEGPTEVLFEKADGTMREMICTLNPDLIDYDFASSEQKPVEDQVPPKERNILTVWDTENEGWRKLTKGKIGTVNALGENEDDEQAA